MKQSKTTGFIVFDFMVEEMGLGGVELLVFALIFSFTRVGKNCHGSLDYISRRVGASYSTVNRAIKRLLEKNYITKLSGAPGVVGHYVANVEGFGQFDCQIEGEPQADCNTTSVKMTDNNKEIKKEITTTTTTTKAPDGKKRPGRLMPFGDEKLVMMTYSQLADLYSRLGRRTTDHYIMVLEKCMLTRPEAHFINHYKTILDWATEDTQLIK